MSVAPSLWPAASLAGMVSIAMIRSAPAIAAPLTADRPMPPQPITATVLPGSTLAAWNTAPYPVITPQPTSVARSSGIVGSIFTIACSCTSICSAKAERLRNWLSFSERAQDSRLDWPGSIFTVVSVHEHGCGRWCNCRRCRRTPTGRSRRGRRASRR